MTLEEIIKIATAILLSLGGGGAIVFAFSSWLGKIWAERIMAKERAEFERELAKLKSELEHDNSAAITRLKTDLEIFRDTQLRGLSDKLATYRLVIDIIASFVADIDLVSRGGKLNHDVLDSFNRGRMKAFGYLVMLAPQEVMESYVALTDYLLKVSLGHEKYEWEKVRQLSYVLSNTVRKDIGISNTQIDFNSEVYKGK